MTTNNQHPTPAKRLRRQLALSFLSQALILSHHTVVSSLAFSRPAQRYFLQRASSSSSPTSPPQQQQQRPRATPSFVSPSHTRLFTAFLDDDDDVIETSSPSSTTGPPVPADMKYIPFNIMRQLDNYKNIRKVGGSETVNDVYVRDPDTSTFWFAGKIARCTGTVSIDQAITRQWHLIEQHAARLRLSRGNNELGPKFGELELWVAPGDSELDVAYNRPHIRFRKIDKFAEPNVREIVKSVEVGYEGELYAGDEEGFRTERDEEGYAVKPEVKGGGEDVEERRATDTEMDDLMERLTAEKKPLE